MTTASPIERSAVHFRVAFPHDGGEIVRNEIAILRFEGEKVAEEQRAQM